MSWSSVALWLSVALTLATSDLRGCADATTTTTVDGGVLERVLLQRARVEAVKRGILEQLGLTEAPRPPSVSNRSSLLADAGDDRRVMAAYRRTVEQTQRRVVGNDVIDNDVAGNDVTHIDGPSARQFYSFKGHGELSAGDRA